MTEHGWWEELNRFNQLCWILVIFPGIPIIATALVCLGLFAFYLPWQIPTIFVGILAFVAVAQVLANIRAKRIRDDRRARGLYPYN